MPVPCLNSRISSQRPPRHRQTPYDSKSPDRQPRRNRPAERCPLPKDGDQDPGGTLATPDAIPARAAGPGFALESIPSLALDLDTPKDLEALGDALLLAPERAPRSAQVLWDLGAGGGEQQVAPTAAA